MIASAGFVIPEFESEKIYFGKGISTFIGESRSDCSRATVLGGRRRVDQKTRNIRLEIREMESLLI